MNKLMKTFLFCFLLLFTSLSLPCNLAKADSVQFILLSSYKETLNIGEERYLLAITTNGDMPTWKSSSSTIASVNTYGKISAKKAGIVTITAKIKNGEASCKVTVNKTKLTISDTRVSIERGDTYRLTASASSSTPITWKSSKKSVAVIDDTGLISGKKPGEATITAMVDGTSKTCNVTIKTPTISLDKTSVHLYRGQTIKLNADVSSSVAPAWRSNKSSVAKVDENGTITAMKHGTAVVTATVDGISRSCEVIVASPSIDISDTELHLTVGEVKQLSAKTSSGNPVVWSTSNENVLSVTADATITAWQKGRAYVYAAEDGAKVRCVVYVTEKE